MLRYSAYTCVKRTTEKGKVGKNWERENVYVLEWKDYRERGNVEFMNGKM